MTSTPSGTIHTLGIFGAGKSGMAIARRALAAGYAVRIATSGPAERTALITGILTPDATAVSADDLAEGTDAIMLAVPLGTWHTLPLHQLAGRTVIDVMNYWPPVDGVLPQFEADLRPTSQIIADQLGPAARLVKTLNHIGYHELEELARPASTEDRTALAISGDDDRAVNDVAHLVDAFGFDPVIAGGLADSAALQPGSLLFGADLDHTAMRLALATASATESGRLAGRT